jgi:hypothetical protein
MRCIASRQYFPAPDRRDGDESTDCPGCGNRASQAAAELATA